MPQAQEKDSLRMRLLLSCLSQRDGEDVSDGGALPPDDAANQFFGISSLGFRWPPNERGKRRKETSVPSPSPFSSCFSLPGSRPRLLSSRLADPTMAFFPLLHPCPFSPFPQVLGLFPQALGSPQKTSSLSDKSIPKNLMKMIRAHRASSKATRLFLTKK